MQYKCYFWAKMSEVATPYYWLQPTNSLNHKDSGSHLPTASWRNKPYHFKETHHNAQPVRLGGLHQNLPAHISNELNFKRALGNGGFWRGIRTWPPWVICAPAFNHKLKKFCIYRAFSEIIRSVLYVCLVQIFATVCWWDIDMGLYMFRLVKRCLTNLITTGSLHRCLETAIVAQANVCELHG